MTHPCRVIKVGGSLFDWPALPTQLAVWLSRQPTTANVLIAGGGSYCDIIRRADTTHHLGVRGVHWLSIRAMHVSAGFLSVLLACDEIASYDELLRWCQRSSSGQTVVFDCSHFLCHEEAELPGHKLPVGDRATSDSIAARMAEVLGSEELVLLKSCETEGLSLDDLVERGIVDAAFPATAVSIPNVRVVNLRAP